MGGARDDDMLNALDGLAESWESVPAIRRQAREKCTLVQWISPAATGIPSMHFACREPVAS